VRIRDITESHRRLLRDLSSRISRALETEFSELPDADGPGVGIILRERRREVTVEIPAALLHGGRRRCHRPGGDPRPH